MCIACEAEWSIAEKAGESIADEASMKSIAEEAIGSIACDADRSIAEEAGRSSADGESKCVTEKLCEDSRSIAGEADRSIAEEAGRSSADGESKCVTDTLSEDSRSIAGEAVRSIADDASKSIADEAAALLASLGDDKDIPSCLPTMLDEDAVAGNFDLKQITIKYLNFMPPQLFLFKIFNIYI